MKNFQNLAQRFDAAFETYADKLAMRWRERSSDVFYEMNYRQLGKRVRSLAAALVDMGLDEQDHVGLIADVSPEWTIADMAIQLIGGVDVPRGTDSTVDDLSYIIDHSGARTVFVHYPSEIDKIEKGLPALGNHRVDRYIVLNDHVSERHADRAVALSDLIDRGDDLLHEEQGGALRDELRRRRDTIQPDHLAAIVYTSGTTGVPKGVQLTHGNFDFQIDLTLELFQIDDNARGMNLLPPWHIFGRTVEYNLLLAGASITYTDIRHLAQDLRDVRPTFFPAVPRIWESFYNKLYGRLKVLGKEDVFLKYRRYALAYAAARNTLLGRERIFVRRSIVGEVLARLRALVLVIYNYIPKRMGDFLVFRKVVDATGGAIKDGIAGGSALPIHVDEFFEAIGIPIREGYGLTETCAVLCLRLQERIVPGTVGPPIPGTEYKLIDEGGRDVTSIPDAAGTLHVRGPHVMPGYYQQPEKTADVLDADGWFNTGDIVKVTVKGDIAIVGRSKDTVVLASGENVEPTPIEEKLKESDFIDHVMVVGQDQKNLGALIVPDEDELGQYARRLGIRSTSLAVWLDDDRVREFYRKEINRLISKNTGFKSFEQIHEFRLLTKKFEKGEELNNTLKIRRHVVTEQYQEMIDEMYAEKTTAGVK